MNNLEPSLFSPQFVVVTCHCLRRVAPARQLQQPAVVVDNV